MREIYQEMKPRRRRRAGIHDRSEPARRRWNKKGWSATRHAGKAYVYCPLVQRESTFRKLAGGFLDQVFDGALGEYVARALQSRRPSLKELEELEQMIAEAKKKLGDRTSRSKEATVLAARFASGTTG